MYRYSRLTVAVAVAAPGGGVAGSRGDEALACGLQWRGEVADELGSVVGSSEHVPGSRPG